MSKKRNGYSGRRATMQVLQGSKKGQSRVKKCGDVYLHPTKGFRPVPWQERRG